ncbi:serine hydrolase domain-containing protein [Foetidibacter luteolus]|uniref:serine hydrolase domain-containing protein n=1 Tax=Foetidibacter luteolus TaxID=2608880 RepID=UPI00129C018A|nr:serine hydrolase domain-containing protein [Foetidibacter luteolus]
MTRLKPITYILCIIFIFCSCSSEANNKKKAAGKAPTDSLHSSLTPEQIQALHDSIEDYYIHNLETKGFNGGILVAKDGVVLFEAYHGFIDVPHKKDSINANTPFHLASVSKTFTGTTVLKLWEQGRISLYDSIQKFFPGFPYQGITVKTLLDHRSGLPNYLYFLDRKRWDMKKKATNQDVVDFMMQYKPPITNLPDRHFQYCNTNYIMLAMIIEKVTGISYPQYMRDSVFRPLGMNNTFVFSITDTASYVPTYTAGNRAYGMDHTDCTYGDKNIYSTPRDMLNWDKALYEHRFVSKNTLDSAFTATSHERPSMHNYGMGWRLFYNNGDTIVYHNGKWHGSNTSFTRLVQNKVTIIVLGNKVNGNIYHAKNMSYIFNGKRNEGPLEE